MSAVLTLAQAEDVAARTLAAIDEHTRYVVEQKWGVADRERVASDLAGLRECWKQATRNGVPTWFLRGEHAAHARRYSDGLLRTARQYGVEP